MSDLNPYVVLLSSMVGFGSLVSILVSVGKKIGFIKDGTAQWWVLGFNILGLALVISRQIFFPFVDLGELDKGFGLVAQLVNIALVLVATFGGSKLGYSILRGMPLIGFSHTLKKP
jgi:hypothetical protein